MIIKDDDVFIDVVVENVKFSHLSLRNVEELLSEYKNIDLNPKEMMDIPNCFAYFSGDNDNNEFTCKIYKTMFGLDTWIMLMKDNCEGYALYENPESHEYELAWYHRTLEEPLSEDEEKKMITCYVPGRNN